MSAHTKMQQFKITFAKEEKYLFQSSCKVNISVNGSFKVSHSDEAFFQAKSPTHPKVCFYFVSKRKQQSLRAASSSSSQSILITLPDKKQQICFSG
jgi:hypothetical protein